jgi:hypothetical protein
MILYNIQHHFAAGEDEYQYNSTDCILIPKTMWEKWIEVCEKTMIVRLTQESTTLICTVGGYHEENNIIICPSWMFYTLDSTKDTMIEKVFEENDEMEPLPLATKIHLRPLDNELYHANIEEEVSLYLSNFQTLQQGCTLVVPLQSLGGFNVDIFVEKCEPQGEVLLRGDVPLELVAPLENVMEWEKKEEDIKEESPRPGTPIPSMVEDFSSFLEDYKPEKKGFVAFSGSGNRLG